jgi:hypothetical protein
MSGVVTWSPGNEGEHRLNFLIEATLPFHSQSVGLITSPDP